MNLTEAQRLIHEREIFAAPLPEHIEFRERLSGAAESVVQRCGMLFAPSGNVVVDKFCRVGTQQHPARDIVTALRSAADALRSACLAFTPGSERALLSTAEDVETHLDAFALAVPAMATPYYLGPIRNALHQIRSQLTPATSPKGGKR